MLPFEKAEFFYSDKRFEALEKALLAKKRRLSEQKTSTARVHRETTQHASIEACLELADMFFENEEWSALSMLIQEQLGMIRTAPRLRALYALSLSHNPNPDQCVAQALASIEDTPEYPESYAALALTKCQFHQPSQALHWLHLAELANVPDRRWYRNIKFKVQQLFKRRAY